MSKEIIINAEPEQTRIAIVENGELAELFIETDDVERTIGNLFLGKVRRVMPSIQAAFIDIGQKQDAFLHFSDLVNNLPDWLEFIKQDQPNVSKFIPKYLNQANKKGRHHPSGSSGKRRSEDGSDTEYEIEEVGSTDADESKTHARITDRSSRGERRSSQHNPGGGKSTTSDRGSSRSNGYAEQAELVRALRKDQPILVRISKEPIQSKGSRITTDISLAGRFLVLVPMANYVAVSKKIMSFKERRRLRVLAKSLLPEGFGVIVRTVASGRNAKALDTDLRLLVDKWRKVEQRLASHPSPPSVIHEDVNMASSIIRDFFSEDFDRILIDSTRLYRNIKGYIQAVAPKMAPKVRQHTSRQPIFKATKIDKAVDQAFESRVDLPSGGYLFIEQTEAMHVIDVNSGRAGRGLSQEDNSLKVNLEAVKIIAQQVRLRDLGGILVVDFIDMRQDRNRRKVADQLRREFRKDRAVTKVLPMSDFGLIQITRQRLRPSITTSFSVDDASSSKEGTSEKQPKRQQNVRQKHVPPIEPEDLTGKIEDWLVAYRESGKSGPVKLLVHPFTASYLNRRLPAQTTRWFLKHRVRIKLDVDVRMDPLGFRFFNAKTDQEISSRPDAVEREERKSPGGNVGRRKPRGSSGRHQRRSSAPTDGEKADNSTEGSRDSGSSSRDSGSSSRDSGSSSRDSGSSSRDSGSSSRDSGSSSRDSRTSGNSGGDSRRSGSSGGDSRRSGASGGDSRRSGASGGDSRRSGASGGDSRRSGASGGDSRRSGNSNKGNRRTDRSGGDPSEQETASAVGTATDSQNAEHAESTKQNTDGVGSDGGQHRRKPQNQNRR